MRIIFFDTETTGNAELDRLCQLGVKDRGVATPVLNELFRPPLPITFEAMAVHQITEKMVADKPLFKNAPSYTQMKEIEFYEEGEKKVIHYAEIGKESL